MNYLFDKDNIRLFHETFNLPFHKDYLPFIKLKDGFFYGKKTSIYKRGENYFFINHKKTYCWNNEGCNPVEEKIDFMNDKVFVSIQSNDIVFFLASKYKGSFPVSKQVEGRERKYFVYTLFDTYEDFKDYENKLGQLNRNFYEIWFDKPCNFVLDIDDKDGLYDGNDEQCFNDVISLFEDFVYVSGKFELLDASFSYLTSTTNNITSLHIHSKDFKFDSLAKQKQFVRKLSCFGDRIGTTIQNLFDESIYNINRNFRMLNNVKHGETNFDRILTKCSFEPFEDKDYLVCNSNNQDTLTINPDDFVNSIQNKGVVAVKKKVKNNVKIIDEINTSFRGEIFIKDDGKFEKSLYSTFNAIVETIKDGSSSLCINGTSGTVPYHAFFSLCLSFKDKNRDFLDTYYHSHFEPLYRRYKGVDIDQKNRILNTNGSNDTSKNITFNTALHYAKENVNFSIKSNINKFKYFNNEDFKQLLLKTNLYTVAKKANDLEDDTENINVSILERYLDLYYLLFKVKAKDLLTVSYLTNNTKHKSKSINKLLNLKIVERILNGSTNNNLLKDEYNVKNRALIVKYKDSMKDNIPDHIKSLVLDLCLLEVKSRAAMDYYNKILIKFYPKPTSFEEVKKYCNEKKISTDIYNFSKYKNVIEFNEDTVKDYTFGDETKKFEFISSAPETRKTRKLIKFVKENLNLKYLLITPNISLSNHLHNDLKEFKFNHYDTKHLKQDKYIIQYQSLHTLKSLDYDVIVIDEIAELFNYVITCTKTNKNKLSRNFNIFNTLISNCKKFIGISADITTHILDTIVEILDINTNNIFIQNNLYEPTIFRKTTTTLFYGGIGDNDYINKLIDSVKKRKKIAVLSNVKSCTEKIRKIILTKCKDIIAEEDVVLITGDLNQKQKKHLQDNKVVYDATVYIYSPVIKSGVSFDTSYFDEQFAFINTSSVGSNDVKQMERRMRRLNSNNLFKLVPEWKPEIMLKDSVSEDEVFEIYNVKINATKIIEDEVRMLLKNDTFTSNYNSTTLVRKLNRDEKLVKLFIRNETDKMNDKKFFLLNVLKDTYRMYEVLTDNIEVENSITVEEVNEISQEVKDENNERIDELIKNMRDILSNITDEFEIKRIINVVSKPNKEFEQNKTAYLFNLFVDKNDTDKDLIYYKHYNITKNKDIISLWRALFKNEEVSTVLSNALEYKYFNCLDEEDIIDNNKSTSTLDSMKYNNKFVTIALREILNVLDIKNFNNQKEFLDIIKSKKITKISSNNDLKEVLTKYKIVLKLKYTNYNSSRNLIRALREVLKKIGLSLLRKDKARRDVYYTIDLDDDLFYVFDDIKLLV